jgi:thiol-disulfide isomerase/thioredoxin
MSDQKIVSLKKYKNSQKSKKNGESQKMFFLVIAIGAALGWFVWKYYIENVAHFDVKIPESKNITFNDKAPISMTTTQIANEFEHADGKPILLYIYTTWCKVCTQNFPVINEIAREFQNTELQVIFIAIDRDLEAEALQAYLGRFGNVYFQPRFLAFKEGFVDFLRKKNINYGNRIPFTVLLSRDGEVVEKYSGSKNQNFLRNKVIGEIYGK